jgi:hypothetical protein
LHERAKPRQIQVTHGEESGQHLVASTTEQSQPSAEGSE